MTITVYRLAQQSDLLGALVGQDHCFIINLLRVSALFWAARHRHDAVRTKLIASNLNSQKGLKRRRSHRRITQRVKRFVAAFDVRQFSIGATKADGGVPSTLSADFVDQAGDLL